MHLSITDVFQILFLNEENEILLGLGFKFGRYVTTAHVACCLTKVMVFSAVWHLGDLLVEVAVASCLPLSSYTHMSLSAHI